MGYLLSKRRDARVIPAKASPCKAKPITGVLNSDSWSGKRCFILCGGPSLEGFDFNCIQNELTIGINKSFTGFNTTLCYAMDQRFYDSVTYPNRLDQDSVRLHNSWSQYSGIKIFPKMNSKMKLGSEVYYVNGIEKRCISLDLSQGIYAGGNSGFGGMMLAIALGSREIYLLGADLKVDSKKNRTHWHEGYGREVETVAKVLDVFRKEFECFANGILELGVKVINLNPKSALGCFPKRDIREIL